MEFYSPSLVTRNTIAIFTSIASLDCVKEIVAIDTVLEDKTLASSNLFVLGFFLGAG